MYSHSVWKNENTLNYHVDQIPTNDVKMVIGGSYRGCLLNHDSYYCSHIPDNEMTVEVVCFFCHYDEYG